MIIFFSEDNVQSLLKIQMKIWPQESQLTDDTEGLTPVQEKPSFKYQRKPAEPWRCPQRQVTRCLLARV